jgi:hypothetical protein
MNLWLTFKQRARFVDKISYSNDLEKDRTVSEAFPDQLEMSLY